MSNEFIGDVRKKVHCIRFMSKTFFTARELFFFFSRCRFDFLVLIVTRGASNFALLKCLMPMQRTFFAVLLFFDTFSDFRFAILAWHRKSNVEANRIGRKMLNIPTPIIFIAIPSFTSFSLLSILLSSIIYATSTHSLFGFLISRLLDICLDTHNRLDYAKVHFTSELQSNFAFGKTEWTGKKNPSFSSFLRKRTHSHTRAHREVESLVAPIHGEFARRHHK